MSDDTAIRAWAAEMGRKGGKASGAKRMEMPASERSRIASIAARARWGHARQPDWPWPTGTAFRLQLAGGESVDGWEVTRVTPNVVYFYKPEYDGTNKFCRRAKVAEFQRWIATGEAKRQW